MPSLHRDMRSSRPKFVRWHAAGALAVASILVPQTANAQTLLESSRFAAGLIRPLDSQTETTRAVNSAGRADPFVPLNVFLPPEPPPEQNSRRAPVVRPQNQAPGLPRPAAGQQGQPSSPAATVATEPTEPEVIIDPAEFAKSVDVSGVITIGGESYALLSAENTLRDVVQTGDFYETAQVAGVSQFGRSVSLAEGGETVTTRLPQ